MKHCIFCNNLFKNTVLQSHKRNHTKISILKSNLGPLKIITRKCHFTWVNISHFTIHEADLRFGGTSPSIPQSQSQSTSSSSCCQVHTGYITQLLLSPSWAESKTKCINPFKIAKENFHCNGKWQVKVEGVGNSWSTKVLPSFQHM